MPIHILPPDGTRPVSRRRFLLGTAAGAAAVLGLDRRVSPGRAADAADPAKPTSWALLADPHIHESPADVNQGQNMAANLAKVAADALAEKPTAALVDGDLAKVQGNPGDYRTLLEILEPLRTAGIPVHLTLGNHDDREKFLAVAREAASLATGPPPVGGRHCSALEVDGVRWLLLDSLEKVNGVPGLLGEAQIRWLASELDAAPEKPALVFVHHNPQAVESGLKDTAELLAVLRPRRQTKAVFFGHTHVWKRWEDDGIHMVNLPAVGYAFGAGEPLGWVRAAPKAGALAIELRALGGRHPDHGKAVELPYRPAKKGVTVL
ncbi:MAG: metallophosphoesterase [Planctomycetes bacterium]|nr:metallophosphoesterase [Planctomycetota bacterium]